MTQSLAVVPPMSKESKSRWPEPHARFRRGDGAGGGTRFKQAHGKSRRGFARGDAAARQHDEKAAAKTDLVQARLQLGEIIRHPLLDVNVRQRRAGALKLANLGDHFGAQRHANLRRDLGDDFRGALFMSRIAKTIEIANADRLDALVAQLADELAHKRFVQLLQDAAVGGHALGHVEAQMARHQRFGQIEIEIVKLVAVLAADLDGVAKPGGRQ